MKKTPAQLESARKWHRKNKRRVSEYNRRRYKANPDAFRVPALRHYRKNRARCLSANKAWRGRNRVRRANYQRQYAKQNRAAITAQRKARYHSDPAYRILCVLRATIACRLNRVRCGVKSASTIKLLGCSIPAFMTYLESKFTPGMSWQNYGTFWEIDHEMPCAIFDLTRPEHQKACFHFSNLQPLPAVDNRAKSDKVPDPISTGSTIPI